MKQLKSMRRIDELGRVVLPIEVRRAMQLDAKDAVLLTLNADSTLTVKKADYGINNNLKAEDEDRK